MQYDETQWGIRKLFICIVAVTITRCLDGILCSAVERLITSKWMCGKWDQMLHEVKPLFITTNTTNAECIYTQMNIIGFVLSKAEIPSVPNCVSMRLSDFLLYIYTDWGFSFRLFGSLCASTEHQILVVRSLHSTQFNEYYSEIFCTPIPLRLTQWNAIVDEKFQKLELRRDIARE